MIKEHDRVVLTADIPEEHLEAGDVGTVVHIHSRGEAFEVEFVGLDGNALAVATVLVSQLRPVSRMEIAHARSLIPA